MSSLPRNLHVAWSRLFVRALWSAGVRHVVVSPGSRSTPLTLACAEETRLEKHVVVDERSAAFFALGLARRTEQPVALLCTSGTAGAHYFPAILEAAEAHVPLVVITADRPWEAYDNASSQTMDQVKLFGDHVRHFAELGLPDAAPTALAAVGRIAAQAVLASQTPVPGPVHVNARFRKPLEPEGAVSEADWPAHLVDLLARPTPRAVPPLETVNPHAVELLATAIDAAPDGLIAVGPMAVSAGEHREVVVRFAAHFGWPLFAEATSQHRFGAPSAHAIPSFDALLRIPGFGARPPGLFVEVGRPLVSSSYLTYREHHAGRPGVRLSTAGWNDPTSSSDIVTGPIAPLLEAVMARLPARPPSDLLRLYRAADEIARHHVRAELDGASFTEGQVAAAVLDALPGEATLLVGNSSPVRDVDIYSDHAGPALAVLHQRGVAGIDGLVAGAIGASQGIAATTSPVLVLLGDVSFAHDIGSLALARDVKRPVVVVVVDNGGGRIFGELPIAARAELRDDFSRFFTTPPKLDLVAIARAFGADATDVSTRDALVETLSQALRRPRLSVLVVTVDAPDPSPRRGLATRIREAVEASS